MERHDYRLGQRYDTFSVDNHDSPATLPIKASTDSIVPISYGRCTILSRWMAGTIRCDMLPYLIQISYRLSRKQSISAGEVYSTICVEWAVDHFGLGCDCDINRSTVDEDMHEKMIFTLSFPVTLTFDLWISNLLPYTGREGEELPLSSAMFQLN